MGTRVIVIGAAGAMCTEATRDLIETSGYDEFMLADLNIEKCNQIKESYKDKNIKTGVSEINCSEARGPAAGAVLAHRLL